MIPLSSYFRVFFIGLPIIVTSCLNEGNQITDKEKTIPSYLKIGSSTKTSKKSNDQLYYHSESKNKKFDHEIVGKDENGKLVRGYINIESEIGIGVVKKEDDPNEIEIISEHINSNSIMATDINGYHYKLKLDKE